MQQTQAHTHTQAQAKEHIPYLDLLRIVSCFLIVCVHVSASHLADLPVHSTSFFATLSYDCLGLIGVPLFVMISGALTLRADYQLRLRHLLYHKTLHFFLLYYIWKAFYQFYSLVHSGAPITWSVIKQDILLALIQKTGYYHLWFLAMLAVLYMFLPIVKKSLEADRNVCRYFLCVFFITALLFPTLFHFEFKFKYLFVDFFTKNDFYLFGGYLGYFVLGHYLHSFANTDHRTKRMLVYLLGTVSFALACALGIRDSLATQAPSYIMNTPFAVTSFFMAIAIFTACQNLHVNYSSKLRLLARTTLGVYLLHPLILEFIDSLGVNTLLFTPFLSIPFITVCIVVICAVITYLLQKIPVIKHLFF